MSSAGAAEPVSANVRTELARQLWEAEVSGKAIPPLSETVPALTVADAYDIQRAGYGIRDLQGARRLVGRKVGLTSKAMQEMLGVHEPDFGSLFDAMLVADGGAVEASRLIAPRVEIEIGFRLRAPLSGSEVTRSDVLAATESVAAALEIIDSRIADWRITLVDTVADNASSACAVFGEWRPLGGLDLAALEGTLSVGGETVSGRGDAVLGHPAEAVAWLARTLSSFGEELRPGDVILPGAMARALPVGPGMRASAHIEGIGSVSVEFR